MSLCKREQEEAELPVQLLQLAGADTSVFTQGSAKPEPTSRPAALAITALVLQESQGIRASAQDSIP